MRKRPEDLLPHIGTFVRQYARRKQRGHANTDPNDRSYDRKLEQRLKKLDPETLDQLLREDLD